MTLGQELGEHPIAVILPQAHVPPQTPEQSVTSGTWLLSTPQLL